MVKNHFLNVLFCFICMICHHVLHTAGFLLKHLELDMAVGMLAMIV